MFHPSIFLKQWVIMSDYWLDYQSNWIFVFNKTKDGKGIWMWDLEPHTAGCFKVASDIISEMANKFSCYATAACLSVEELYFVK